MLCSDLERYLEAFLDGRLGRSRTTILRRHLGLCGPCRARVERLRRFEREIGRQTGATAGEVPPSVWQGLEIDLVRSLSLAGTDLIPLLRPGPPGQPRLRPPTARAQPRQAPPPPASSHRLRRRVSRLAGVLAVALAVGALYELARAWLMPADAADAAVETYLDFVAGGSDLALRTDDPASLQHWFATQLGQQAFPTPPMPAGFKLVGGGKADLGEVDAAMLVYAPTDEGDPHPTLLFVQASPDGAQAQAAAPIPVETGGYHQLVWQTDPYSFRLVSAEPPARLHEFAR
jgi:anti-sigma factor RsiW